MKAYCYFHSNPNWAGFPHRVMDKWRESWQGNGFECAVLREADAKKHPLYDALDAVVSKLPTVNAAFFERACWIRWLAYWTVAPAVFTDFDVINYSFKPSDVDTTRDMMSYEEDCGVGVVWATRKGIEDFIDLWQRANDFYETVHGKPHISDMFIFKKAYRGKGMDHPICEYYGGATVLTSKAVHFGNARLPDGWKFNERWKAIDALAARRKEFDNDLP